MSNARKKPQQKPASAKSETQPEQGSSTWKKPLGYGLVAVGLVYAALMFFGSQTAEAEEADVPKMPDMSTPEGVGVDDRGFLTKWIDRAIASTKDEMSEQARELDARESELDDREKMIAIQQDEIGRLLTEVTGISTSLQECSLTALKEVRSVTEVSSGG